MARAARYRRVAAGGAALLCMWALAQGVLAAVSDFETDVVDIINEERAALGRDPLGTDERLWNAIELHAEWMAAGPERVLHAAPAEDRVPRLHEETIFVKLSQIAGPAEHVRLNPRRRTAPWRLDDA